MENFTKKKLFCEGYILPKIKKKERMGSYLHKKGLAYLQRGHLQDKVDTPF